MSIYMSRAELEEISEGLITAYSIILDFTYGERTYRVLCVLFFAETRNSCFNKSMIKWEKNKCLIIGSI